jgi:RecA/RadA recombinase
MDFLKDIVKEIGGEYTQLASQIDESETYVDTGSYIFNALVSGSIFGGVSGNKITAIAGESSTGKCARGTEKITIYGPAAALKKIKTKLKLTSTDPKSLELTYEQLYGLYGKGEHEVPYDVKDEIYVATPNAQTRINQVVTKHNNEVMRVIFTDGDVFECSVNHLFMSPDGSSVRASDATVVSSSYGDKTVASTEYIGTESVYDISIDAPHWYIARPESGIYHHNTFFSLAVVKNFLDTYPDGYCLYFDTEAAITKSLLESRGVDINRTVVVNVVTVEEFRTKALKAVDIYLKAKEKDRKPCIFVLDSLGMLSTNKEINDALAEKDTRDMTKAQLIKGAFRMLTLKLGQAKIPMLVTNHTYESMSLYGGKQMSGGSGLQYSSSTIIYLSKSKEKDGTEVVGNIIRCKTQKSRLSKENQEVQVRLYYDERGLDRYYGLLELGELGGLWKKSAGRYEMDGKKIYGSDILKNPEKYFTADVMEKLDVIAKGTYSYGAPYVIFTEESNEEETEN